MNNRKVFGDGTHWWCTIAVLLTLAFAALTLTGCEDVNGLTKSSLTGNVTLSNHAPKVGDKITATYAPGNGSGAQTWQWFRVNGTEELIQGAATNAYTAVAADVGKRIKVKLSFTDQIGSLSATTTSAVTSSGGNPNVITYTAAQDGGTDGTANSTGIKFTFSAAVTGLTANDITVTNGTGTVTKGALNGSGTSWTLGITVTTAGNVTVSINKTGIAAGTKNVTVYKQGQTVPTLTGITAVYTQGATIVYPTTPLDDLKTGLTVTAQYDRGGDSTLSADDYSLSVSGGVLTVGTSAVTVSYTEGGITETDTFTVTVTVTPVNKTLTGITLNTASVNKNYTQNEQLNLTGLIVTANYSNSPSEPVTGYTSNPADGEALSSTGQITVTVSYTEGGVTRTASFIVNVTPATPAKTLTGITAVYESEELIFPDTELDILKTGLTVTANYSDGSSETLEPEDYTLEGTLTTGDSLITVTYQDKTDTFTITVQAPHAHNWTDDSWEVTEAATCETDGLETRICTALPAHSESRIITKDPNAHDWGNWATTAPTATTDGIETRTCNHNSAHTETRTLYATGTDGLEYQAIGNPATAYRVSKGTVTSGVVYIPAYHRPDTESDYLPVTHISNGTDTYNNNAFGATSITGVHILGNQLMIIDNYTFYNCTSLASIDIPIGVMSIGAYAFQGCANLASITIPTSVTSINPDAFYSSNFASIEVDGNNLNYASQDGILYNKAQTQFIHIPSKLSGNVTIPEGITSIGNAAFQHRTSLTGITIPTSVTSIGYEAFRGCTSLATVTFAEGSQLATIGNNAFRDCTSLSSINIPTSVTSIDYYAFSSCTGLTSVTIPASVTSINYYAFAYWTSSQTIYIEGYTSQTAADAAWNANWRRDCDAVIVYGMVSTIEITQQPNKTTYKIGEQFDITGFVVTATLSDNTTEIATITAANITGFDSSTAGNKTITVTYRGKTATFTVTIIEVASIAVTQQPNKTAYKIGEQFDITGLVVTATYSDNTTTEPVTVTTANITGFNSATTGSKTLTITYSGKTTTFTVTIIELSSIAVTRLPFKTIYAIGDQLNITGLEVTATYSDNTTKETVTITATDISGFSASAVGEKTLTVTYGGKTATFTVTVAAFNNITVTNTNEWDAALSTISNGGNDQNYIVTISGNVAVSGSTNNSFSTATGITVTLKGSGTLSLSSNGNMIRVGVDQTLIIDSQNLILQGKAANNNSLVYVGGSNAKLELWNGTISGNNKLIPTDNRSEGGGVYVSGGTFTMSGGKISDNSTSGGVYSYGGGVYVMGTFTMIGGEISGNSAFTSGAVNMASSSGGGVYVGGSFTMSGGKISGNSAYSTTSNSSYQYVGGGGGVYVSSGTFTMTGGEISGNTASGSGTGTGTGGGIRMSGEIFRVVTGTIYGSNASPSTLRNTATTSGAALYITADTTAQYGTFNGETWNSNGSLTNTENTINVLNGALQ